MFENSPEDSQINSKNINGINLCHTYLINGAIRSNWIDAKKKRSYYNTAFENMKDILNKSINQNGEVKISQELTFIPSGLLEGNEKIKKVFIPNSIKRIENNAFANCVNLEEIKYDGGCNIEYIGPNAFKGCNKIKTFTIPNTLSVINDSTFEDCTSLQKIICIDQNVHSIKEIGKKAFKNCKSLEYFIASKSFKSIGKSAFKGCESMRYFCIPDILRIGLGNNNWPNESFPDEELNLKFEISERCFANAFIKPKKENENNSDSDSVFIVITANVVSIGKEAFLRETPESKSDERNINKNFGEVINEEKSCKIEKVCIRFRDNFEIGENAFKNNTKLKVVEINALENVNQQNITIKSSSFMNCINMEKFSMPFDCKADIGEYCFYRCQKLSEAQLSNLLSTIPQYSFYYCSELIKINISDTVTKIEDFAFAKNSKLEKDLSGNDLSLPKYLEDIGRNAFEECVNLKFDSIPPSVKKINDSSFSSCEKIIIKDFSDNLVSIGAKAFKGCSGITNLTIPSQMTNIGKCAFKGCKNLSTVKNNSKNINFGENAFADITRLNFTSCIPRDEITETIFTNSQVNYILE